MEGKLEKVRAEIERRRDLNRNSNGKDSEYMRGVMACYSEVLAIFEFIQGEPISEDFEVALAEEWKGYNDRGAATVDALEDNTQELAFAKGFYRGWHYKKEEPISKVSEDFEEAYDNALSKVLNTHEIVNIRSCLEMFKFGANWKEELLEKNRLAHCDELTPEQAKIESDFVAKHLKENNRTPTFIDAIEHGMRLKEEQMMKDAFEREVKVDAGGYPYIPQIELWNYDKDEPLAEDGDTVRVIVTKEEKEG